MTGRITHEGNNTSRAFQIKASLPNGSYYLQVGGPQRDQTSLQVIITR